MPDAAFVTASYGPDFERCKLLCRSMDQYAKGWSQHYILVASNDVALFKQLEGPKRTIVDERDLLPFWLRRIKDPLSGFRRDMWAHPYGLPLRGWHVQQLRRIAIARYVTDDGLIAIDSDVVFVAPYDAQSEWRGSDVRLYRVDNALNAQGMDEQKKWSAQAASNLGISDISHHDYINTLIVWRRADVLGMMAYLEAQNGGTSWVKVLCRSRALSECMHYGRYVDDVMAGQSHFTSDEAKCRVLWRDMGQEFVGIEAFIATRKPWQIAVGLQSFIGLPEGDIAKAIGL